jgi:hypothetical protein
MNSLRIRRIAASANVALVSAIVGGVALFSNAQERPVQVAGHTTEITSVSALDSVKIDSTLAVTLHAENRSRTVEEVTVSLVDSTSGDTIERWYPILPPESRDSSVILWNTKGAKPGRHTLRAILASSNDSIAHWSERTRVVTVNP